MILLPQQKIYKNLSYLAQKKLSNITVYTDGAAKGNPGAGGFGFVLLYGTHKKEFAQGYRLTTNNRMELLAVIVALESIKKKEIKKTTSILSNLAKINPQSNDIKSHYNILKNKISKLDDIVSCLNEQNELENE